MEDLYQSEKKQSVFAKIFYFPLTRIVLSSVVCFFSLIVLKSVMDLLLLDYLEFDESSARKIRFSFNFIVLLAVYYGIFRWYEKRKIEELSFKYLPYDLLIGFFSSVIALFFVLFIIHIFGYVDFFPTNKSPLVLFYPIIFILFFATFEEIFFRGIFYRIAEQSLGTTITLILTGALFGLGHASNPGADTTSIINVALAGILLGTMYTKTGRLWIPIFFHTGWNYAQVITGCKVSGTEQFLAYAYYDSVFRGPDYMTGGAFGPENSIITTFLLIGITMILYMQIRKSTKLVLPFWKKR